MKTLNHKGFTLLEVLVASLIGLIVMSSVTMLILQNAHFSTGFVNRTEVCGKLNLISRTIEMQIKTSAYSETMADERHLYTYDKDSNFVRGYLLDADNRLRRCDVNGNDLGDFNTLTANCTFTGSRFFEDGNSSNNKSTVIKLAVQLLDTKNKRTRFSSPAFSFYANCRSN